MAYKQHRIIVLTQKDNRYLDITGAAVYLGVSKTTLRRWDNEGVLVALRLGKRGDRRWTKEQLDKFIGGESYQTENSVIESSVSDSLETKDSD